MVKKAKTKKNEDIIDYFYSLQDDVLMKMTINDWKSLESLCLCLTLDIHFLKKYTLAKSLSS